MSVTAENLPVAEPSKPLLDPEEMAEFLDISRSTLDRWSKAAGFPVLRTGRVVKFPWRQVVEFLAQCARDGRELPSRRSLQEQRKRGKR